MARTRIVFQVQQNSNNEVIIYFLDLVVYLFLDIIFILFRISC